MVILKKLDAASIKELNAVDHHLNAFQYPTTDQIHVTFDNIKGQDSLKVTNIAGQVVYLIQVFLIA